MKGSGLSLYFYCRCSVTVRKSFQNVEVQSHKNVVVVLKSDLNVTALLPFIQKEIILDNDAKLASYFKTDYSLKQMVIKKTNQKHPHWTGFKKILCNTIKHKRHLLPLYLYCCWMMVILFICSGGLLQPLKLTLAIVCLNVWLCLFLDSLRLFLCCTHLNYWFAFICNVWEVTVVSTEALSVLKLVLILVKESGCFCAGFFFITCPSGVLVK